VPELPKVLLWVVWVVSPPAPNQGHGGGMVGLDWGIWAEEMCVGSVGAWGMWVCVACQCEIVTAFGRMTATDWH
jgi:hypothetical protein